MEKSQRWLGLIEDRLVIECMWADPAIIDVQKKSCILAGWKSSSNVDWKSHWCSHISTQKGWITFKKETRADAIAW